MKSLSLLLLLLSCIILSTIVSNVDAAQCTVTNKASSCVTTSKGLYCPSLGECIEQISTIEDSVYIITVYAGNYTCPGAVKIPNAYVEIKGSDPNNRPLFVCKGRFLSYNIEQNTQDDTYSYVSISNIVVISSPTQVINGGCIMATVNGSFPQSNNMVSLSNSDFTGCFTNGNGGLYYSNQISFTMTNSSATNCIAVLEGAVAFHYPYQGSFEAFDSKFTGNSAVNGRGGVYVGPSADFNNCVMKDNVAMYGGVSAATRTVMLNCQVEGNTVSRNGGAIFTQTENSYISIQSTSFNGNGAKQNGGAISSSRGSLYIKNSTFSMNVAEEDGGAVYFVISDLFRFLDNEFNNNKAANGGAIYLNTDASQFNFYNSYFKENVATEQGGAIYFETFPSLYGGIFEDNQSSEPKSQTFPASTIENINIVNISNSTAQEGNEFIAYVWEEGRTYWNAYDAHGECVNGIATIFQQNVITCQCFQGWSGSNCDTVISY